MKDLLDTKDNLNKFVDHIVGKEVLTKLLPGILEFLEDPVNQRRIATIIEDIKAIIAIHYHSGEPIE